MPATVETTLQDAYGELLAALVDGPARLDALVSEHCQVIGPKGFLIGKDEWIGTHNGEVYEQVMLESVESDARVYGDTAVRWDLQRSECRFQGETIKCLFRVLSVWHHEATGWQLVTIQYTAVS